MTKRLKKKSLETKLKLYKLSPWLPTKINDVLAKVLEPLSMYSERFLKSLKTRAVTTGYPAKAQWSASSKPGFEPGPPGGAADRTERTRAITERPSARRLSHPPGQSPVRKHCSPRLEDRAGPHAAFAPVLATSQRATGGSAGRRRKRRRRTGSAPRKPLACRSCSREIGPPRFHLLSLPRAGPAAGTSFHMGLGPSESGQRSAAEPLLTDGRGGDSVTCALGSPEARRAGSRARVGKGRDRQESDIGTWLPPGG